jgi:hypothetical protein
MKRLLSLALGLFLLGSSVVSADGRANGISHRTVRFARPVKVMTQNLYIGADLNRVLGVESLEDLPEVVAETFAILLATDFPERAEALADQVARFRPHVIGLQEAVVLLRQSPGDFFLGNPVPAQEVEYDYLAILLDALAARGLHYTVAARVANADIEVPMHVGLGPGGMPLLDDIRTIDHDVILVRSDVAPSISHPTTRHYTVNLQVGLAGIATVELTRGVAAVDVEIGGTTYRVVTTHLEERLDELGLGLEQIQAAQASELIAALDTETLPVILLGDLNSSPADRPTQFAVPPYQLFTGMGYTDIWHSSPFGHHKPGLTCCQEETLTNETSTFDRRIDHIFVRNGVEFLPAQAVGPNIAFVVGERPQDKTPSGLWPSDHAGIFARMRLPVQQYQPQRPGENEAVTSGKVAGTASLSKGSTGP